MPLTRSQLLKILADNKRELENAESEIVDAYEGSGIVVEAELIRYLEVLRKNVARTEKLPNQTPPPARVYEKTHDQRRSRW
jgi:hypothetical protein